MPIRRRPLVIVLALLLVTSGLLALVHRQVHRYDGLIVRDVKSLDTSGWARPRVAVVFGASVYSNGELSPLLEDRVSTAIDLYRSGKVDRILVSGDNRVQSYNEPKAMQEYLVSHAVAARDVVVDYAGRSTYETCFRAKEIFGLHRAVLVTQAFHLPRALYLANELGLEAYGVATDADTPGGLDYLNLRELAADIKAFFNVHGLPPKAVLGDRLPIK
jgi:SanA protein